MESKQTNCYLLGDNTHGNDDKTHEEGNDTYIISREQNKADSNEKTQDNFPAQLETMSTREELGPTTVTEMSADPSVKVESSTSIQKDVKISSEVESDDSGITNEIVEKITDSENITANKDDAAVSHMGYRGDDESTDSDSDSSSSSESSSDTDMMACTANTDIKKDENYERLKESSDKKACTSNIIKTLREEIRTRGEIFPDELPPIEDLTITVDKSEELLIVGTVTGIVDVLVVIQSETNFRALNEDTVLFNENRQVFGKIFEVFGPVCVPMYSVRFNSAEDIVNHGIEIGQHVFCAPKKSELTQYVFLEQLQALKGSDASWEDNHEPPQRFVEFSDDEEERKAKAMYKKAKQAQNGRVEDSGRNGGPPQRTARAKRRRPQCHSNGADNQSYRQDDSQGSHQYPNEFGNQGIQNQGMRPQFHPNPWQQGWSQGRQPHPGRCSEQMNSGLNMPYGHHSGPPPMMLPVPNQQQFAGPPQFMTGPRFSQNYQHPQNTTFGMQTSPSFGHHPDYNSQSPVHEAFRGPDNPAIFTRPPPGPQSNRTALLGPGPGAVGFRGAPMTCERTFPPPVAGHQMGDAQSNFGQNSFGSSAFQQQQENISMTNNYNPAPIDRRYIQNSNVPNC